MSAEHPRIFLGTADTSSCMSALAEGFRRSGCVTTTMVTHPEYNTPDVQYDIMRGRTLLKLYEQEKLPRILRSALMRLDRGVSVALNGMVTPTYLNHDMFVFISEPWIQPYLLFPLLKRLNKKVVVYYLGSDVRHLSAFQQEFGIDVSKWASNRDPLDKKVRYIRWGELYADLVYSVPDQAGLQIRPYYHAHVPVSVRLDAHIPGRVVPTIIHAPSRRDIKGTSFVIEALERLRKDGVKFEFQLLSGLPRQTVLDALVQADIVVDQLFLHGPGVLGAEAMTAGCAVATRVFDPAPSFFAPPVCSLRPDNVDTALRRLITDVSYRVELAARGAAWARTTFDPLRIARGILSHLNGQERPEYVPSFYLDRYVPPTPLSPLTRTLSSRVTERFRPEQFPTLSQAAARGVVAWPR